MNITVPDATISAAALTVASAMVWAIRTLTKRATDYFDTSDKRQEKILDIVERMASDLALGKQLGRLFKAVQRLDSKVFTCDVCGGWDGPQDAKPKGLEMCRCSDPATSGPQTGRVSAQ